MKVSSFILTDINKVPAVIFTIAKGTPNEQKREFFLTETGTVLLEEFALKELGVMTNGTVMDLIYKCRGRTLKEKQK